MHIHHLKIHINMRNIKFIKNNLFYAIRILKNMLNIVSSRTCISYREEATYTHAILK